MTHAGDVVYVYLCVNEQLRSRIGRGNMNANKSSGWMGNGKAASGRRDALKFVGGGGVLLLANACALDTSETDGEDLGSAQEPIVILAEQVRLAYRAAFNRTSTLAEESYWLPRQLTMTKLFEYLRGWMRTVDGAGDRVRVIRDSYYTVYKRLYTSSEFAYWSNYLSNNNAAFCDVCKWNEAYGRDHGFAQTGWYKIKHNYSSAFQSDTSIEDYSGKTYNV